MHNQLRNSGNQTKLHIYLGRNNPRKYGTMAFALWQVNPSQEARIGSRNNGAKSARPTQHRPGQTTHQQQVNILPVLLWFSNSPMSKGAKVRVG